MAFIGLQNLSISSLLGTEVISPPLGWLPGNSGTFFIGNLVTPLRCYTVIIYPFIYSSSIIFIIPSITKLTGKAIPIFANSPSAGLLPVASLIVFNTIGVSIKLGQSVFVLIPPSLNKYLPTDLVKPITPCLLAEYEGQTP